MTHPIVGNRLRPPQDHGCSPANGSRCTSHMAQRHTDSAWISLRSVRAACCPLLSPGIADAVGAQLIDLPMTPERVLAALDRSRTLAG